MLIHIRTEEFEGAAVEGRELTEDRQRGVELVCITLFLDGVWDLISNY